MTGHVFYRRLGHDYPVVQRGEGAYLYDTAGRRYLDAAGGALVANIGHGVTEVAEAMAAQARRVAFAHGTQFTSEPLEAYAAALGEVSPIPDPWLYLVSGGSEDHPERSGGFPLTVAGIDDDEAGTHTA